MSPNPVHTSSGIWKLAALAGLAFFFLGAGYSLANAGVFDAILGPELDVPPSAATPALKTPTEYRSSNGQLQVTMEARATRAQLGPYEVNGATYNGVYGGPVLRLKPGDVLRMTLVNHLAQATNVHFHGLQVSPQGHGDDSRDILRSTGALMVGGFASALARPALAVTGASVRSIAFNNLHTGERLNVDYWIEGDYVPDALASVNRVLRDFRTGDVYPIARSLLDLLSLLRRRLDNRAELHVISGYRSPVTNAKLHEASAGVASNSLHMKGMAIDIRIPGCELSDLRMAALSLRAGGVGYYPKSNFVHVDVGRIRTW